MSGSSISLTRDPLVYFFFIVAWDQSIAFRGFGSGSGATPGCFTCSGFGTVADSVVFGSSSCSCSSSPLNSEPSCDDSPASLNLCQTSSAVEFGVLHTYEKHQRLLHHFQCKPFFSLPVASCGYFPMYL